MRIIVLAVLLAVVQTSPPVPRQTSNANTGKGQSVQNDTDANEKPPEQEVPVVQKVQPPPNENTNPNKDNQNAEEAVRVRELPPVSIMRDWMDCLALVFSAILLGVGVIGVRAAYRTLKAIETQGGLMEGQLAQTSVQSGILQDSVELVINKERARIRIGKPEPLVLNMRIPMKVEFRLFFYGSTPAFSVTSEVTTVLSESRDSSKQEFRHGIHELPEVASVSDFTATFNDFLLKPLPLDELTVERIRNGEVHVHFSGWIKYLDFFDKPRETAFHYRWNPRDDSANSFRRVMFPEGWEKVGGAEENYYT